MLKTDTAPLTITELTQAIKKTIEPPFRDLYLKGEISNFKRQSSGHLYFSLKDAESQISAVMFRGDAATLQVLPKNGDHVEIRGDLSVYPPRGSYQVVVRYLRPKGIGTLLLKLDELKRKILKKGWFSKERKKPIPALPRRIGIITSPTGAAIQDILHVLERRFANVHIVINPVRVQGTEAAGEIVQAIDQINRYQLADVLIVGRGGGSLEDLWAFNEEIVAKAIYDSEIPIIAAVGHETDHTIAEYVADVRAPTPSAAAELVISEKSEKIAQLEQLKRRLAHSIQAQITQGKHRLHGFLQQPAISTPYGLLAVWIQKTDTLKGALDQIMKQNLRQKALFLEGLKRQTLSSNPILKIHQFKEQFRLHSMALVRSVQRNILVKKEKLSHLDTTLSAIDPKNLLKNGYSILFSEKDQSVINSVERAHPGDSVRILLKDGELGASVTQIHPKK